MKMGERTLNNALFSAVSGLLPLALSLIFWPFIVGRLGESSYGIFALVGSVIGYFALLDLGLGTAVVKYVAEHVGRQDTRQIKDVIGVSFSLFLAAGVMGMLLIFSLADVLASRLLKIPPDLIRTAYLSFSAASLGFFFTMLMTLFSSIINGLSRYDISSITSAAMGVVSTLGAVLLLRAGFGLLALVWLNVAVPAGVSLFYFFVIRHLLPDIPIRCSFHAASCKRVLHFGMYTTLGRITDVITRQVAPLLIGVLLGVDAVTFYVIPFTILNRLTALLGRIGVVILPAISELQGRQRTETIRLLYLTSYRIILSFAFAFSVSLLIFGARFLTLWMGPDFSKQGGTVLLILTVGVFFDLCTYVPSFVVNGLGRPKISGFTALSQALLFLGLMIPGAKVAGIIGVASAYGLSLAIVAPFFVWFINRNVIGLSTVRFWKETCIRPLLAGLVTAIPLFWVPKADIHNIFLLLAVMASGMGLYFVLALAFGVYQAQERGILMEYLRKAAGRLRGRGGI
jgi:O-antigen/teichoic acid export membrane protein